jgi:HEAT repeat protein
MKCRYLVLSAAFLTGTLLAADSPTASRAWNTLDEGLRANRLEHREQTVAALSTLPGTNPQAVQKVVSILQHDGSTQVRQTAALALGDMKAQSAVPELQKALSDSPEVAFAAAKSLTELGNPAGEQYMITVLKRASKPEPGMMANARRNARKDLLHPQNLIFTGAAGATGIVFPPAAIGVSAAHQSVALRSHGGDGRAAAATYLAKEKDTEALNTLEWALKDHNPAVQVEAAKGLGDLGNPASIDRLIPLLKDPHIRVRTMAAASIIRLSH